MSIPDPVRRMLRNIEMSVGMAGRYVRKIDGAVIVNYHGIEPSENIVDPTIQSIHIDPAAFRQQLEFIGQHFEVIADLNDLAAHRARTDKPAALITFDDGYRNFQTYALPILEELGMPSTVYITGSCTENDDRHPSYRCKALIANLEPGSYELDSISRTIEVTPENRSALGMELSDSTMKRLPWDHALLLFDELESFYSASEVEELHAKYPSDRAMTWDQVREVMARGVIIGSHTMDHVVLGPVQSDELVREQVIESKRLITERVGECKTFAYPNGSMRDISFTAVVAVEEAGYEYGFSTVPGVTGEDELQSARFVLPRLSVSSNWSGFRKYVSTAWRQNPRHAAFMRGLQTSA